MELPQGQTGSVGTTVASAEQVSLLIPLQQIRTCLFIFHTNDRLLWLLSTRMSCLKDSPNSEISSKCAVQAHRCGDMRTLPDYLDSAFYFTCYLFSVEESVQLYSFHRYCFILWIPLEAEVELLISCVFVCVCRSTPHTVHKKGANWHIYRLFCIHVQTEIIFRFCRVEFAFWRIPAW